MSTRPDRNYPDLETCLAQVSASQEWLERRILPLSLDQLRWRPRSRSWSIAGCLDHLNRTFAYYLPKIEQVLDKGRTTKCQEPALGFEKPEERFLSQMEPPVLIALSAPAVLLPAPAVDPELVVDQFPHLRSRFAKAIQSVPDMAVLEAFIHDSVHPPVQSLGGVLALLASHERRHLWQAQQVLSAADFPAYLGNGLPPDDREGRL